MSEPKGEEIVKLLSTGADDDDLANELLKSIWAGYPVENVSRLLHARSDEAVKAGAWVLSELGADATSMLFEVDFLLRHSVRHARFFALDVALVCATEQHGELIARAISLVGDEDGAVRWKALRFLGRAGAAQLAAGAVALEDVRLRELVEWLAVPAGGIGSQQDVVQRLDDQDDLVRLFAVAAASREAGNSLGLVLAADSTDPDVAGFARDELQSRQRDG